MQVYIQGKPTTAKKAANILFRKTIPACIHVALGISKNGEEYESIRATGIFIYFSFAVGLALFAAAFVFQDLTVTLASAVLAVDFTINAYRVGHKYGCKGVFDKHVRGLCYTGQ